MLRSNGDVTIGSSGNWYPPALGGNFKCSVLRSNVDNSAGTGRTELSKDNVRDLNGMVRVIGINRLGAAEV